VQFSHYPAKIVVISTTLIANTNMTNTYLTAVEIYLINLNI